MTQTSLRGLVESAAWEEPRHLQEIYAFVQRARPGTPKASVRRAIYQEMERTEPRIVRVTEGVYLAASGPGRLLILEMDAWRTLEVCEDEVFDLIFSDPAYRMGTDAHVGKGTTRPHAALGGRTYETRDLDEAFLRNAFRVLKSERAWAKMGGGETTGGGAMLLMCPSETKTTWPHLRELIDLAEACGFTYYGRVTWKHDRSMGWDVGAVEGEPILVFQKGDRGVLFLLVDLVPMPLNRFAHQAEPHRGETKLGAAPLFELSRRCQTVA